MSKTIRDLAIEEVLVLPPGSKHYRAYVGPPTQYDFMGATQFRLLCALGLREHHRVLDFGCGSLRLGRLLIPYLLPGNYFGIEPNRWLVADGIDKELGRDAIRVKQPSFDHNHDFDCSVFDVQFDFVIAQSILTHCGIDVTMTILKAFAGVCRPKGLIAFSIVVASDDTRCEAEGWHYPACVAYGATQIQELVASANMFGTLIPWYHPRCAWYLASPAQARLPTDEAKRYLTGLVLNEPDFSESVERTLQQR